MFCAPTIASLDVEQAFSRIKQELALKDEIAFSVTVEGRPRPVHPIIRDEVYFIGREALVNGFRHSRAKSILVKVEYKANSLRIVVRDDGAAAAGASEGRRGLAGMQDQAIITQMEAV